MFNYNILLNYKNESDLYKLQLFNFRFRTKITKLNSELEQFEKKMKNSFSSSINEILE